MSSERRSAPRKPVSAVGFLYTVDGWPLGACRLKDISAGGARIAHAVTEEVPAQLLLSLARDGSVLRRCEIAWRGDKQIGVRFLPNQGARTSNARP
jgi:hypothetical protein